MFPEFMLNKITQSALNTINYSRHRNEEMNSVVHYDTFFYPLDFVLQWNKLYGTKGFLQYQFVIPLDGSFAGIRKILDLVNKEGRSSFLAVLKLFGEQEARSLSFPIKGYTLALDFPVRNGIFTFLDKLDEIVLDYGGRIYLAKDARMKGDVFTRGYKNGKKFLQFLNDRRYTKTFQSLLYKRISG